MKKILHVCLASFYIDNYSYQENLLPKYHQKLGYEVEILASLVSFDKYGNFTLLSEPSKYKNENGIPVTRIDYKKGKFSKKLRVYKDTYKEIEKSNPDIIFIHGCQFLDMKEIVKYLKLHNDIQVFVDNHADFSNSATNWLSKNILHKKIWKYCAQIINPYTKKFYGVLPARVDFLKDVYKIPEEKIELLVMGGEDNLVKKYTQENEIDKTKNELNISNNEFVIVTGGKIDAAKTQTLLLMEAIQKLNYKNIKLVVFGTVTQELELQFNKLLQNTNIEYLGWLSTEESYKYLSIADLVIFPGRHSVYWEQVVSMGIPMFVKYWEGTTHVDIGGNVDYLIEDSIEEILDKIKELIDNSKKYKSLKMNAQSIDKNNFLYSNIAEKSIKTRKKDS